MATPPESSSLLLLQEDPEQKEDESSRDSNRTNRYKGFSTSICDLFHSSDPLHKEDCCAFACCGLLAQDKTEYLFYNRLRQQPSRSRSAALVLVPIAFVVVLVVALSLLLSSSTSTSSTSLALALLFFLPLGFLLYLCLWNHCRRVEFRRQLVQFSLQQHSHLQPSSPDYLQDSYDANCARCCCCGCYSRDDTTTSTNPEEDFCTKLWTLFANGCCGTCFGCWYQCCGCCATAQEAREVQLLLPTTTKVDYWTMEDHANYFPSIQQLRMSKTMSFVPHFRHMSQLSQLLLQSLAFTILLLVLVAILNNQLTTHSTAIGNLLVFLCTLIQAFLVLFFVHWKWNRLDISVDAVIKFFASGFLLSTGLAMGFEMVSSTALQILLECVAAFWNTVGNNHSLHTKEEDTTTPTTTTYPILTLLYLMINAYAIAALIEELCKYFGFWMVDHPDLAIVPVTTTMTTIPTTNNSDPRTNVQTIEEASRPTRSSLTDTTTTITTTTTSILAEHQERRSYVSFGSAITISMIAVSLGFACCENLIYVFIYARGNVNVELTVLLMRSLFPIQ